MSVISYSILKKEFILQVTVNKSIEQLNDSQNINSIIDKALKEITYINKYNFNFIETKELNKEYIRLSFHINYSYVSGSKKNQYTDYIL